MVKELNVSYLRNNTSQSNGIMGFQRQKNDCRKSLYKRVVEIVRKLDSYAVY